MSARVLDDGEDEKRHDKESGVRMTHEAGEKDHVA